MRVEYDEYPDRSSDPRDWDGSFLWLGFPHRHYDIGDERLDPSTFDIECRSCHGDGKIDIPETNHDHECPACNGYGRESAGNLTELIELVKHDRKARVVVPVGMIDHSGIAYYLGGGEHPTTRAAGTQARAGSCSSPRRCSTSGATRRPTTN